MDIRSRKFEIFYANTIGNLIPEDFREPNLGFSYALTSGVWIISSKW